MTTKRRDPVRRPLKSRTEAGAALPPRTNDATASTAAQTAAYIAEMTHELAGIARGERQDMLAYFLTMARMEAEAIARGSEPTHPR